jgi:two-component system sensor histidine kinase HydH
MVEHRITALSLRSKLLLFAGTLVLVPGLVLALLAEQSSRASLERVIGRQLDREAGHTANRLSAVLRTEREALANFAQQDLMRDVRVADIDKRVSVALATLRSGSPPRLDYLVVDSIGEVVASSDPSAIGPAPAWARAGSPGGASLRGPLQLAGRAAPVLVMTTPIPDPDGGGRLGTLVGLYDWRGLTRVTQNVRRDLAAQGIEAEVLVTAADGRALGGTAPALDDGSGLITGRARLAPDLPAWELLVAQPRSEALAPARRLSQRLVLTMGVALVAALVLATLGARRVVRPLSELTRAIRDLSPGHASASSVPVRSDDEVGVLAGAFNEMASQLERAQRELVEAEKFAFVGELAAGVAHEIRTALGVLRSSTQMLERSLPEDGRADAAELAQMIRAEVDRLADVVNDLLTLDRERPLVVEAAPASEPLFRAVDFVGPQAQEKQIRIRCTGVSSEPNLRCDTELVYQVAVNLLVNATQALSSGGSIEVKVLEASDGMGGFEVRDDGPGIPDDMRDRIFRPFVTARDGGVGLGLTFVQRVVHEHRGLVSFVSGPGEGACVRVRIPLADPPA